MKPYYIILGLLLFCPHIKYGDGKTLASLECDSAKFLVCESCSTIAVCLYGQKIDFIPCKDMNQNTPYCQKSASVDFCSETPTQECRIAETTTPLITTTPKDILTTSTTPTTASTTEISTSTTLKSTTTETLTTPKSTSTTSATASSTTSTTTANSLTTSTKETTTLTTETTTLTSESTTSTKPTTTETLTTPKSTSTTPKTASSTTSTTTANSLTTSTTETTTTTETTISTKSTTTETLTTPESTSTTSTTSSTTITNPSNNQFICYSAGFLPEPKNCKQYRDCTVPNKPILQHCQSGTQYSATTSTCDASAECIEVECTESSEEFVAYTLNSPFYIWCDRNPITKEIIQNVLQCQRTWIFDVTKAQCVAPVITVTTSTAAVPTTTTSSLITTSTTFGPDDVYICDYIGLLPEPKNCATFRDCTGVDGSILQHCPPGTQYDAASEKCDAAATCIEVECTSMSPPILLYALNSPYFIFCEVDQKTKQVIQHLEKCMPGLIFDAYKGCQPTDRIESTTTSTTTTTKSVPIVEFTCDLKELVPDPSNCLRYRDCRDWNQPLTMQCPPNTRYNAINRLCDSTSECIEVDCNNTPGDISVLPYAPNSPYYVRCLHSEGKWSQSVRRCATPGIWDQSSKDCIATTTATPDVTTSSSATTTSSDLDFVCTEFGLLPDSTNCERYLDCTNGKQPVLKQCPTDTRYNATTETCDVNGKCIELECESHPAYLAYTKNSPYYVHCTYGQDGEVRQNVLRCPSGLIFDLDTTECILPAPVPLPNHFICNYNELLPDPSDCSVYQDCSDRNQAIIRYCAEGTTYDAANKVCTVAAQCNTVDCNLQKAFILPYATQSQFYIFCSMGRSLDVEKFPIVMKCPEGRIYDPLNFSCILDN